MKKLSILLSVLLLLCFAACSEGKTPSTTASPVETGSGTPTPMANGESGDFITAPPTATATMPPDEAMQGEDHIFTQPPVITPNPEGTQAGASADAQNTQATATTAVTTAGSTAVTTAEPTTGAQSTSTAQPGEQTPATSGAPQPTATPTPTNGGVIELPRVPLK